MTEATEPVLGRPLHRFRRYPGYKDSGVEWLGEIPERWEVKPLKSAVSFVEGPGILAVDFVDEGIPLLRLSGIGGRVASLAGCNFLPPELVLQRWSQFRVETDDLLISGSASTGVCSEVDRVTAGAVPYTGIMAVRPRALVSIKDFVRWFFLSEKFLTQTQLESTGSTIQHFGPTHLAKMAIILPPILEQRTIAAFLERETARIDALVAKKERLIELLLERRTARITQVVAKGLDSQVPMKDTGVEWLGEIPAHWHVKPLKAVSSLQTGLTLGKQFEGKSLVSRPYLRVANVQDGYLALEDMADVELPGQDATRYELRKGDVLMTEGGDFDKLGRGHVWEGQIAGCLHQNHIFAVRPRPSSLRPYFLALVLSSGYGRSYFTATSKQSTNLASTNSTKLLNLPLPLPDVVEQDRIISSIMRETEQLDALIGKVKDAKRGLNELRTALISAAVTGKIDVRDEVA